MWGGLQPARDFSPAGADAKAVSSLSPLRSLLRMRRLVQMLVKPQILPGQQLSSKNNLPGMLPKVLDSRIDPLQYRDTILLRLDGFHQALGLHRLQHFDSLGDSALQPPQQLRRVNLAPRGELRVAGARIGPAADAADNPLPHISGDVEQQV